MAKSQARARPDPQSDISKNTINMLSNNIQMNKYVTDRDRDNEIAKQQRADAGVIVQQVQSVLPFGEVQR